MVVERISKFLWRTSEFKVIKEHYPRGGAKACAPLLPGRSLTAISRKASELGVKAPSQTDWVPPVELTPEQWALVDEAVRRSPISSRACAALATRAQLHMKTFASRVRQRGGEIVPPPPRRAWTAVEDALLREHSDKAPRLMRAILCEQLGSRRSMQSIHNRRVQLGITGHLDRGGYTGRELARLLGVTHSRAARWIDSGLLEARRYQRSDPHRAAGGLNVTWVIPEKAVRKMLRSRPDLLEEVRRTADRVWLADLLGELPDVRQESAGRAGTEDAAVWLEAA